MAEEPTVLRDSPEAATYRTDIAGWVSRHGRYYGENESTARWDGCTHVACEKCGTPTEKLWLACEGCRDLSTIDRYAKRPRKAWDGEAMLFSERTGAYYRDMDDVQLEIDCTDEPVTIADMMLVICDPNHGRPLTGDYFEGEFAEDEDESSLPTDVWAAMEAFNEAISEMQPLSWSPGKFAIDLACLGADAGGGNG